MKTATIVLSILILFTSATLHAEPVVAPFNGENHWVAPDATPVPPVITNAPVTGNSLSGSIAASKEVSTSKIFDNSAQNNVSGREYKAGDGERQSNAGMAAAIVAGTGMTAAAIPLLASLDPIEVAAGADLMAKAGLEFAQAGADAGTAHDNGGQKNLLTANVEGPADHQQEDSANPGAAGAAKDLSNNQQLQNFLQGRGVNSDDFIKNLTSGNLTDPSQVLSAVGNTTNITPEDMAKGAALADASAPPEGKNPIDIPRVTNDDNTKGRDSIPGSDPMLAGAGGGNGAAPGNNGGKTGADAGADGAVSLAAADAAKAKAQAGVAGGAAGLAAAKGFGAGGGEGDDEDLLASILRGLGIQQLAANAAAPAKDPALKSDLAARGVIKLNPKQNIFQLAHRNYRSFQKWRETSRVAQR
jgi:hypothetical protein